MAMKFSLIAGAKTTTKENTNPTTERKRAHTFDDDDDEDDDKPKQVAITGFGEEGVIEANPTEKKRPAVIQALPNRDWREEGKRRRQQNGVLAGDPNGPGAEERKRLLEEAERKEQEKKVLSFGLTISKNEEELEDVPMTDATAEPEAPKAKEPATAITAGEITDEVAIQALLGGPIDEGRVIVAANEEEALQRDLQTTPDAPSLAAYQAMPVESFALAYLRGYGYKDEQEVGNDKHGKPPKGVKAERRPALLGIGAKPESATGIEPGAWGKASKGRRKTEQAYTPVVMVNRKTGDKLTEEELQKKLEQQTLVEEEKPDRRNRRSPSVSDSDYRSKKSSQSRYDQGNDRRRDRDRYEDDKGRDSDRNRDRDRYRDRGSDHKGARTRDKDSGRDRRRERDYDDSKYSSSRKDNGRRDRDRSYSPDDRKRKRRDYEDNDVRDKGSSKRRYEDDKYNDRDRGSSKRDERNGRDKEKERDHERDRDRDRDRDRTREKYTSSSRRPMHGHGRWPGN